MSLGGSVTGSLDHGVSRFNWLLIEQVHPAPVSETRHPKLGLAITLIHGAGVHCPSRSTIRYSWPSAANPPRPLKNSSSRVETGAAGLRAGARGAGRRTVIARASGRWA